MSLEDFEITTHCSGNYVLAMQDGSSLPSFVAFDASNSKLSMAPGSQIGNYDLRMKKVYSPSLSFDYYDI